MTLHLVELVGREVIHFHAEPASKLTHVLFGHNHLLVLAQHGCGVLRQRVDVLEVGEGHLLALGTEFVHCSVEVSVGAAKANDEEVGIVLVAQHFEVGHLNLVDFLLTQMSHQVVVLGVGGNGTRLVVLLQATEDVLEAFASGHCPVAHTCFGIAEIRCPLALQFLRHVGRLDGRIVGKVRQFEGSRAVGHVGIGHEDDGRHVLQCHLGCGVGRIEAVGGRCGSNHRHGRFAVTSEEGLQEVGLLRLGGQTRGRTATLHVEHHEGQLHDDGEVHGLTLQADAGTRGGSDTEGTGKGCTYSRCTAGNLVLTLHGGDTERLVLGEFVQHVGGRGDGVRAEVELQARLLGSSDEAVGCGLVARDVHIASGHLVLRLDAIDVCHARVSVVSVVVARLNHLDVGLGHTRLLGKFLLKEIEGDVQVAVEEPAHQSECEHVAALQHGLHVHARVSQTVLHHLRDGAGNHTVGVDAHLAQIVFGGESRLLQVGRAEGVGVDDDGSTWFSILVLSLECCSVHGHEHIALVAWRIDHVGSDVYLKTAHTRQRTLRCADVGGIVRKRTDTVAHGG